MTRESDGFAVMPDRLVTLASEARGFGQRDDKMVHGRLHDPRHVTKLSRCGAWAVRREHHKRNPLPPEFARYLRARLITERNVEHGKIGRIALQPGGGIRARGKWASQPRSGSAESAFNKSAVDSTIF
jgi:hypothetical protein